MQVIRDKRGVFGDISLSMVLWIIFFIVAVAIVAFVAKQLIG
tara:strand:+ start:1231 stop:1356 length:126 start_codon:yes stop_codon:yes gene_type:complete